MSAGGHHPAPMRFPHILASSALAVLPYLAFGVHEVLSHDGAFTHFSQQGALLIVGLLALMQFLTCLLILFIASFMTARLRQGGATFTLIVLVLLIAAYVIVNPSFGSFLSGPAAIMVATGLLALGIAWLFKWRSSRRA